MSSDVSTDIYLIVEHAAQRAKKSCHAEIEVRHLAWGLKEIRPRETAELLAGRDVAQLQRLLEPPGTHFGELIMSDDAASVIDQARSAPSLEPILDAVRDLLADQPVAVQARQTDVDRAEAIVPSSVDPGHAEPAAGETFDDVLKELRALVGLERIKREVEALLDLQRFNVLRSDEGLPADEITRHLIFTGNPGTGKTTVARLLGRAYASLNVLSKGTFREVSRADLIAAYVGQTAKKTADVIQEALGGVLFIDEAYALFRGDRDYGQEAVAELLQQMENHRDDLVVIVAGYPGPLREFIDSNPGLQSRFGETIDFPDYGANELRAIFDALCEARGYQLDDTARQAAHRFLDELPRDRSFGNARTVRNVLDRLITALAIRLRAVEHPTREDLTTITEAECDAALVAPTIEHERPTGQYL